jgi:hypothetical protein
MLSHNNDVVLDRLIPGAFVVLCDRFTFLLIGIEFPNEDVCVFSWLFTDTVVHKTHLYTRTSGMTHDKLVFPGNTLDQWHILP